MNSETKKEVALIRDKINPVFKAAYNSMIVLHKDKDWFDVMFKEYTEALEKNGYDVLISPISFCQNWMIQHDLDIKNNIYSVKLPSIEDIAPKEVDEDMASKEEVVMDIVSNDLELIKEEVAKQDVEKQAEKELRQETNAYGQYSNNKKFNNYQGYYKKKK